MAIKDLKPTSFVRFKDYILKNSKVLDWDKYLVYQIDDFVFELIVPDLIVCMRELPIGGFIDMAILHEDGQLFYNDKYPIKTEELIHLINKCTIFELFDEIKITVA